MNTQDALRLFDVIYTAMFGEHVGVPPAIDLAPNNSFANIIQNVKTLRSEFVRNFHKYPHTQVKLKTTPLTEEEIDVIRLISFNTACRVNSSTYIQDNFGVCRVCVVGESEDFELVAGEEWVAGFPKNVEYVPDFDPKCNLTPKDFYLKHVLFGRIS